jgi:hypothetical protein
MQSLSSELRELYEAKALDGFGLYIYGVVLKEMQPVGPVPAAAAAAAAGSKGHR